MSGLINVDLDGDGNTVQGPGRCAIFARQIELSGAFQCLAAQVLHDGVQVGIDLCHAFDGGGNSILCRQIPCACPCCQICPAQAPNFGLCHDDASLMAG